MDLNKKLTFLCRVNYVYGFNFVGTQAQVYIRPWALSEEVQWSENRSTMRKE